jgi:hypothetical protein
VSETIPYDAVAPRDGAVAADAAIGPTNPSAKTDTTTSKFLLNFFIFLLVHPLVADWDNLLLIFNNLLLYML